jgi:ABC-type bacteriocin/lantibiotic exporter with double-glycine peptidase domain
MNRDKSKIVVLPIKPVVQKNHYECGVACVGTILKTMGLKYNHASIKKHLGANKEYGTLPRRIKGLLDA